MSNFFRILSFNKNVCDITSSQQFYVQKISLIVKWRKWWKFLPFSLEDKIGLSIKIEDQFLICFSLVYEKVANSKRIWEFFISRVIVSRLRIVQLFINLQYCTYIYVQILGFKIRKISNCVQFYEHLWCWIWRWCIIFLLSIGI